MLSYYLLSFFQQQQKKTKIKNQIINTKIELNEIERNFCHSCKITTFEFAENSNQKKTTNTKEKNNKQMKKKTKQIIINLNMLRLKCNLLYENNANLGDILRIKYDAAPRCYCFWCSSYM